MKINKSALKKIIIEEKQKLKENDAYDRDSGVGGGGIALSALMLSPVIYGHLEQIMKEMGVGLIEAAQYMVMHFPQEAAHMVKILLSAGAAGGMIHEEKNFLKENKKMKILKSQLKKIVNEERELMLKEAGYRKSKLPAYLKRAQEEEEDEEEFGSSMPDEYRERGYDLSTDPSSKRFKYEREKASDDMAKKSVKEGRITKSMLKQIIKEEYAKVQKESRRNPYFNDYGYQERDYPGYDREERRARGGSGFDEPEEREYEEPISDAARKFGEKMARELAAKQAAQDAKPLSPSANKAKELVRDYNRADNFDNLPGNFFDKPGRLETLRKAEAIANGSSQEELTDEEIAAFWKI